MSQTTQSSTESLTLSFKIQMV